MWDHDSPGRSLTWTNLIDLVWSEKEDGVLHLAPTFRERLCVGNCIPPRILVRTKALSKIIRPSSELIRIRWVGHHSSRNVLIRIVKIAPPAGLDLGWGL
jgi:hypothetical protein